MKLKIYLVILFMIVSIAVAALIHSHNRSIILQGEVDAPQVIITSKAKGRVITHNVRRGDDVLVGQLLMTLDSPELLAQFKALESARDQAKAQLALSEQGTREEILRSYRAQLSSAQSAYINADRDYKRNQDIAKQGYISSSVLDGYLKARDMAAQQVKSTQADLDQAINGDLEEQRQIYRSSLIQAEEQLRELQIQLDDLLVLAPVDGEVGSIPAEVGGLQNALSPLLTIERLPLSYLVFNLREDILARVRKGDRVKLTIPALNMREIEAEVRYIAALGDFATKRATRATGDFDLKTFEVRLYTFEPIEGLRPGMSVLWEWHK